MIKNLVLVMFMGIVVANYVVANEGNYLSKDIPGSIHWDELSNKIQNGVINMMPPKDTREAMVTVLVYGGDKSGGAIYSPQQKWSNNTSKYVIDEVNRYLGDKSFNISQTKLEIVKKHIEQFSAFKASNYSRYKPSKELGIITGMSIAQGIRWFAMDKISYPNNENRDKAKQQINQVFSKIESKMIELTPFEEMEPEIHSYISHMQKSYSWKADSPFFVHGKKILSDKKLEIVIEKCLEKCQHAFDILNGDRISKFPESFKKQILKRKVSQITALSKRPLIRAYAENMDRPPSPQEIAKINKLLKIVVKNEKNAINKKK